MRLAAGLAAMLTAAILMLLAAFSPFTILKLIPIVESSGVAEGIKGKPYHAAREVVLMAGAFAGGAAVAGGAAAAGGGGGGGR